MGVQIEIDETILMKIDLIAQSSQKSRYETVNELLTKGLRKRSHQEAARQFEESYRRLPITQQEIDEMREWEDAQDWGDE